MSRNKQINITKSGEYMRMYNADTLKGEERRRKSAQRAKEWRDRNPEYCKLIQQRSYEKIRIECFNHYGNGKIECRCCSEKEIKFLHLDHKNGDGAERRKEWESEKTTINHKSLENKMINAVIDYLDKIIKYVDPKKGVYIAIDGPVCAAKMKQQRQRRFRSYHDKVFFDKIII